MRGDGLRVGEESSCGGAVGIVSESRCDGTGTSAAAPWRTGIIEGSADRARCGDSVGSADEPGYRDGPGCGEVPGAGDADGPWFGEGLGFGGADGLGAGNGPEYGDKPEYGDRLEYEGRPEYEDIARWPTGRARCGDVSRSAGGATSDAFARFSGEFGHCTSTASRGGAESPSGAGWSSDDRSRGEPERAGRVWCDDAPVFARSAAQKAAENTAMSSFLRCSSSNGWETTDAGEPATARATPDHELASAGPATAGASSSMRCGVCDGRTSAKTVVVGEPAAAVTTPDGGPASAGTTPGGRLTSAGTTPDSGPASARAAAGDRPAPVEAEVLGGTGSVRVEFSGGLVAMGRSVVRGPASAGTALGFRCGLSPASRRNS